MVFVDDNVSFAFGATHDVGKTKLQAYLQRVVSQGALFKLANGEPTAKGNIATFAIEVAGGAHSTTYQNCAVTLVNQKITNVTCK